MSLDSRKPATISCVSYIGLSLIKRKPPLLRYIFYEGTIIMLAALIREFCSQSDNSYKVYENYTMRRDGMFGEITVTTIAIIAKGDCSAFEIVEQMANYLLAKGSDAQLLNEFWDEIDGFEVDMFGADILIYFPAIRNYRYPLPPKE